MKCQHCKRNPISRPRRLCWECFYRPGVRDLYPSTHPNAYRGLANGNFTAKRSGCPTQAKPGSPEKIAVLAERVRQGVALWHADDAPLTDTKNEDQKCTPLPSNEQSPAGTSWQTQPRSR